MRENSKEEIYIKVMSKAFKFYLKGTPPSRLANDWGISTSTTYSLYKGDKNFNVTSLGKIAHALGLSLSIFIEKAESFLPEGYSLLDE